MVYFAVLYDRLLGEDCSCFPWVERVVGPAFFVGDAVRIEPRFQAGLRDIEGFERIWLVYWLHQAPAPSLLVTPFLDSQERGIFATRAPARPSGIGLSAVRLLRVEGNLLHVADVDMVSGTPLLDIKPYVPEFDCHPDSRAGWFDQSDSGRCLADDRFESKKPAEGGSDR